MLRNTGLDAEWQSEHEGNKTIDIEVHTPHQRIAVECEKYGSSKRAEAVKDAASRLHPIRMVDIGVAVVYPKGCDSEDDFTPETKLSYCIVNKMAVAEYGDDYKTHSKSIPWMSCPANGLAAVLKNLYRDTGEPDIIANRLKKRLSAAVNSLTISQCRSLAGAIDQEYASDSKLRAATKRALLVVAAAALFHARLASHLNSMERPDGHDGRWPPPTLDECHTRLEVIAAWNLILKHDYRPIFQTGIAVLVKSTGQQFASAIESVITWARETADDVALLRHDLLGQMFHAVLDTAKQDGSLYTTTPAAVLLAGLAIRDRSDIPKNLKDMSILDPACGTGTLLMAAAERVRDIMGDEYDPNNMVENVLCGVDINVTAAHMAATTIGMLSPDTKFDRMGVYTVALGVMNGEARAGSLELYAPDGLRPYQGWYGAPGEQVDTGEVMRRRWRGTANLLIMNPPFPRNNKRHDQLGKTMEKAVKNREGDIFEGAPKGIRYSSGPMFMLLAEHLIRKSDGCLAVIVPMVMSNNPSNKELRVFLAEKFHIDTIVAPHDPERFYFSDNTTIAEMLVVLRRGEPRDTKVINLAVNPGTVAEAASLANTINDKRPTNCQVHMWPRSKVKDGNWSGIQFYSIYLVDRFMDISDAVLFETRCLGDVAEFVNFQNVYKVFTASDASDRHARHALVYNSVDMQKSLNAVLDKYLIEKSGYEKEAKDMWDDGCLLHLQLSLQPSITHVTAIKTDDPSIGFTWRPVRPKVDITNDVDSWSKAMTVYLNSTIGVTALLGVKNPRKPLWPRYPIKNLEILPIPDITEPQMRKIARVYNRYKHDILGILRNPSAVRVKIDEHICKILDVDKHIVSTMRRELAKEPMITGKRYGVQPDLLDRYE